MVNAVLDEVLASRPTGPSPRELEQLMKEIEKAQHLVATGDKFARSLLAHSIAMPAWFRGLWQAAIREPSATLHQNRRVFENLFHEWLQTMDAAERLAASVTRATGEPLPTVDKLPAARAELAAFADMILSRWTSQEELEELMADTFELPKWLTDGPIPPHLQPPQSWYDETTDPSQPAAD